MVEKKLLSQGIELHFDGLFIMKEVTKLIEDSCEKHNYTKEGVNNYISTTEKAKTHTLVLAFSQKMNEYDTLELTVTCTFSDIKPTFVIKDGIEHSAQKGKIVITFTGLRKSKREGVFADRLSGVFASKAFNYFTHVLISKFIVKSKFDTVGEHMIHDIRDIKDDIHIVLSKRNFEEVTHE